MNTTRRSALGMIGVGVVSLAVGGAIASGPDGGSAQDQPTATPFHEGFASPAASPELGEGHFFPLPAPEDLDTSNSMTAAAISMIQAGEAMDAAAQIMVASSIPELVELGEHWHLDAQSLRDRGVWMITSATSLSMVHDANKARELDVASLGANGMVMEADGQAMIAHGQEMLETVEQLRASGSLPAEIADTLTERATALIEAGEQMEEDGKRMQDQAEDLRGSLGL